MIIFSDHIGRIVAAELLEETDTEIKVSNPVIIHAEPQPQTGQIQVHTFPYLFMEFTTPESRENNAWTFNKSSIVVSDIKLEDRLLASVEAINNPAKAKEAAASAGAPEGDAKIVSLFDE